MAVIVRITDFIPNTLIESQEVDDEFNQLVNLLSGVSTNKDTLLKYDHATDPVLRVDQLGAGAIQRWLQNGVEKAVVNNDGSFNIGTPGASPTSGKVSGATATGTNIAGGALRLAPGLGTGTGVQPDVAAFLSKLAASGTGQQSLTATAYPFSLCMLSQHSDVTVQNTTTETSIIGTLGGGTAVGTKVFEANSNRVGRTIRIVAEGFFDAFDGGGTVVFRVKLNSSAAAVFPTITPANAAANVHWRLNAALRFRTVGSSATVAIHGTIDFGTGNTSTPQAINRVNIGAAPSIDMTVDQTIDITVQMNQGDDGVVSTYAGYWIDF
jgi:hypothetical protein